MSLLKYQLCSHYILPGFFAAGCEIGGRRGTRGDRARDLVLVRNYNTDNHPTLFKTHSPSFKKSFFYRALFNYNILRREIDLDAFSFRDLRRVISLYSFDDVGFVIC